MKPLCFPPAVSCLIILIVSCCYHCYDFWYIFWNGLKFFELFKLLFSNGIDHDLHVFYDHMTYVYFFFLCFFLHMITWPSEVIIIL